MKILNPSKFALFSMNGLYLLIGFKGSIYSLDKKFYDFLSESSDGGENRFDMLEDLTVIEKYEGECDKLPVMPGRTLRALCLNITSNCNLRCEYCFADTSEKTDMTIDTAKKAFEFLLENSDAASTLQIDFFGGEPLLNFSLIKEFVPYAKSFGRDIKFTLTTNAALLSGDIADFLNKEKISLIMSLDGNKNINDIYRKSCDGSSSWQKIVDNIKNLIHSRDGGDYYVRGTFTPNYLNLKNIGSFYEQNKIYRFSLEGAKGKPENSWAISQEHVKQIKLEYEKLADFILEKKRSGIPLDYFHFNIYLDTPLCASRRLSGCGAGVEYLSVSPKGELYPCHQLHEADFSMGTVFEKSELFFEKRDKFSKSGIAVKNGCLECWARFYCCGGCHAQSWFENKDINIPSSYECELQKHRIKCAVWLEAMSKQNEPLN